MPWYVYLLRCSDGSLYCGITTDLPRRIVEHNEGIGSRYTRSRLPVHLAWSSPRSSRAEAAKAEFHIKRLPKEKKELLASRGTQG